MTAHLGRDACPKNMVYGPCGGVSSTGGCEAASHRCGFLDTPLPLWPQPAVASPLTESARAMAQLMVRGRVVVADFPANALEASSLSRCADSLAGTIDATLVGDSPTARVQFSPAYRAHRIQAYGLPVWSGLNCRDRNRVALEGEIAALADVGVAGVHCVTGDHPRIGGRPDARAVFDLDSTRLSAIAAQAGHLVSVAESPTAPHTELRPRRLQQKMAAGARICFVNHCGGGAAVQNFIQAARAEGVTGDFIACVPVVVDRDSAEVLAGFTNMMLPAGFVRNILSADDIYRAGVNASIELAEEMLAVPGVRGVNLSGGPVPGTEVRFTSALVEISRGLRRSGLTAR